MKHLICYKEIFWSYEIVFACKVSDIEIIKNNLIFKVFLINILAAKLLNF